MPAPHSTPIAASALVGTWYVYTEYGDKIDEITVTAKTVKTRGHLVEEAKASQVN